MFSEKPKVLHEIGGQSLLRHVLDRANALQASQTIVVIGHGGDAVKKAFFGEEKLEFVEQSPQLGTGHAVMQAMPLLNTEIKRVLVLYGDVPLLPLSSLKMLVDSPNLAILTTELVDPTGYGRIVRYENGSIARIVEEKDADDAIRQITEINTGILCLGAADLVEYLQRLENKNAQGEYYLTDIVEIAANRGNHGIAYRMEPSWAAMGVNNRRQQAELERHYQWQQAQDLLEKGVTLLDPQRFDVRGTVKVGRDVVIDVNVVLSGTVALADGVVIGAGCIIHNAIIGKGSQILPYSVVDGVKIGEHGRIGPFARLRPGTILGDRVHIGNFVEVKNSQIGAESKANHLSYLGDAQIGDRVNVGAGSITCNYDGVHKHQTIIEDGVFIGSNTALVAPVRVGAQAVIGAGSVITKAVPQGMLALTRAVQKMLPWRKPTE